jgi:ribosomal-protein-alanine N-acetyltransferase
MMTISSSLERIETERLVCERLRMDHLPEISRLLGDPRVSEWLWPHGGPTEQDLTRMTTEKESHWERHGFGIWLLRDIRTQESIGWGGLQWTYLSELNQVEAAWAISPERWGQGLATEMAQGAITAAFGPLGLRELIAFTLPNNLASRRVMEKTGFVYERDIVHALLPHVLYRRRADPD